jgi:hypothetical protein
VTKTFGGIEDLHLTEDYQGQQQREGAPNPVSSLQSNYEESRPPPRLPRFRESASRPASASPVLASRAAFSGPFPFKAYMATANMTAPPPMLRYLIVSTGYSQGSTESHSYLYLVKSEMPLGDAAGFAYRRLWGRLASRASVALGASCVIILLRVDLNVVL